MRYIILEYKTLKYDSMDHLFSQLLDIINDKQVNKVVVGIPYNMKGEDTKQTEKVRDFVSKLECKLGYDVILIDERLTSSEAEKFMHQMDIKVGYNKDKVDKIAASIILNEYLETI